MWCLSERICRVNRELPVFVNDLIKIIKEGCEADGFLAWIHILVLMDDTVLLATSRENMIKKITLLHNYCKEYGMKINQSKTKFFCYQW